MVESKLVELVVAGSSPVGHPNFTKLLMTHTVKRAAIEAPDLKPVWDSMGGTLLKRME